MNQSPESARVPPYSKEAESAVLGAALLYPAAYVLAAAIVGPQHFYLENHRRIWSAMARLHKRGEPIDQVTIGHELRAKGDLEKIGGAMALNGLTDSVATVSNIEHYAKIVRGLAGRRAMIYAAQQIVADGYAETDTPDEYLAAASTAIAKAISYSDGRIESATFSQLAMKLVTELETKQENPDLIPIGIGGIRVAKVAAMREFANDVINGNGHVVTDDMIGLARSFRALASTKGDGDE